MYPSNYDEDGDFVSTGGHENDNKSWNQGYDNSADHYTTTSNGGNNSDSSTNSDNVVTTTDSDGTSMPHPGPDTYDDPSDVGSTEEERMIPDGDSGDGNDTFDPVDFNLGNGITGVITNQPGTTPDQNDTDMNLPSDSGPNVHPPAPDQSGGGLLETLLGFFASLFDAIFGGS